MRLAGSLTLALLGAWALGCIPKDRETGNEENGKLKCFQCDSRTKPLCSLSNWKFANRSVRRVIIKQCPRKYSAFCYIKTAQNGSDFTERGCYRKHFMDGKRTEALVGCVNMGEEFRVCLCKEDNCNFAPTPMPGPGHFLFIILITFIPTVLCSFKFF